MIEVIDRDIASWLLDHRVSPTCTRQRADRDERGCGGPLVAAAYEDDEKLANERERHLWCAGCGHVERFPTAREYARALRADADWLRADSRKPAALLEADRWDALAARLDPDPRQLSLPEVA